MSKSPDGRSRTRLATRQAISNAATRLFIERGFDHVTVDEIAATAGVGRMTVFNHFPRKEDMFFDLDDEGRETLREALRQRESRVSPIEALRLLAHRLITERSPFVEFSAENQYYIEAIEGSEALKARARAIRSRRSWHRLYVSALVENLPMSPPSWQRICFWQPGPWPSSTDTGPFGRVKILRRRKLHFSLSLTAGPWA